MEYLEQNADYCSISRFVILEHDYPELHWDFMLEWGEALRSWRLAAAPGSQDGPIAATPIPDHRRVYLDYEGPVSGGRGSVKRWDWGEYSIAGQDRNLVLILHGRRLHGQAILQPQSLTEWHFSFTPGPPTGVPGRNDE